MTTKKSPTGVGSDVREARRPYREATPIDRSGRPRSGKGVGRDVNEARKIRKVHVTQKATARQIREALGISQQTIRKARKLARSVLN